MTGRITQHVSGTREYGRKPYLVTPDTVPIGETSDYRYMMKTTWHKQQDNEKIVVQSVKKKPYNQQDYQMMEQSGDFLLPMIYEDWKIKTDFGFPKATTITSKDLEEETITSGPSWLQCSSSVAQSNRYIIVLRNAFYKDKNGIRYFPATFSLQPATSDSKGFSLWGVSFREKQSIVYLDVSSLAGGSYYIHAESGGQRVSRLIGVSSGIVYLYAWNPANTKCYIECTLDLVPTGTILPFDQNFGVYEQASANIVFDYGAVTTRTETLTWSSDGGVSVSVYRYNAEYDGETETWVMTSLIDVNYQYKGKSKTYTDTTVIGGETMYAFDVGGATYGIQYRAVLLH